jgi:hypothetical protein
MNGRLAYLEKRPEWLGAGVIFIILLIFAGWGLLAYEEVTEKRAREAVLSALNELSSTASVTIDGEAQEPAPVLEALRALKHVDAHHSYPLESHQVEIRDGSKTINLVVAQDSERPDEYWVYRPGPNFHNDPHGEFLGRIETKVFRDVF